MFGYRRGGGRRERRQRNGGDSCGDRHAGQNPHRRRPGEHQLLQHDPGRGQRDQSGRLGTHRAGVYTEEVKVKRPHRDIHIRGLNRNTVILDGQGLIKPGGRNGIEVVKDNEVWIENMTARNFERESLDGPAVTTSGGVAATGPATSARTAGTAST